MDILICFSFLVKILFHFINQANKKLPILSAMVKQATSKMAFVVNIIASCAPEVSF
jgi:hypothetical protein